MGNQSLLASIYVNSLIKMAASPRKEKKPKASVKAVTKICEPNAGSDLNHFKLRGISVPTRVPTKMFIIIARPRTIPKMGIPFQKYGD